MPYYDLLIFPFLSNSSALTGTGCRLALFRKCGRYHEPWHELPHTPLPPPPKKTRFFGYLSWSFSVHIWNFRKMLSKAYCSWVLQATERLRQILGSVHENELGWRLIYNEQLYELLNEPNVVKYIKFKRLQGRSRIV
jgi:hypothetical protein